MSEQTVPKRILSVVERYPEEDLAHYRDSEGTIHTLSYRETWENVRTLGAGLLKEGIKRGDHIGIMSDNSYRWLLTDLAVLSIGAVDIPRGSDSTADEMSYILAHADCKLSFAENMQQVEKILSQKDKLPLLKTIIVLDPNTPEEEFGRKKRVKIKSFDNVFEEGKKAKEEILKQFDQELEKGKSDDIATILYTSGTTGEPKGVRLRHRSFLFQLERVPEHLHLDPSDIFLSVLPIWHSFERAVEYVVLSLGVAIAYSKPIGKVMLKDFEEIRPTWMTAVPRIWEGIRGGILRNINSQGGIKKALFYFFLDIGTAFSYLKNMFLGYLPTFRRRFRVIDTTLSALPLLLLSPLQGLGNLLVFGKIKKRLGGRFVAGVSGGGALPPYVDSFYQAAGIKLLEGYGLTETGPILSVRLQHAPVGGTVGPLLRDIEHRLLNENGREVGPGRIGNLFVKSDQVMQGYYKKPEETEKVLSDGWLDTGDLAKFTHRGELTIVGRVKDTIVLLGGENIEPNPIEENLVQSDFIDQAMVVGQDQKFLGALIVPNSEKIEELAKELGVQYIDKEELLENEEIKDIIYAEIQYYINPKRGFKAFERIFRFRLLANSFEVGNELTRTLKIRRNVVYNKFKREIAELFQ